MTYSGYDFGYLIKLLTNACLPNDEKEFFDLLHIWFPSIYDVKFIMRACKPLKGGLQDVADDLGVRDVGYPSLLSPYTINYPRFRLIFFYALGNANRVISSGLRLSSYLGDFLQDA